MTLDPLARRRPLNFLEACQWARELWGERGTCEVRSAESITKRFVVGTKGAKPGKGAFGCGSTWEEAFADAQRNGLK